MIGPALLGAALAAPLPACPPPVEERLYSLGIRVHGHTLGGLAAVAFPAGADFRLVALSPAGPALFSVQRKGALTTVDAAFPEWRPWLEALPFERDLRLVDDARSASCADPGGRIHVRGEIRRWRGTGGPARARVDADGRWVVHDPLRGYTLTLKEAG